MSVQCRRTKEVLERRLDGAVAREAEVDRHLAGCSACREALRSARTIHDALRDAPPRALGESLDESSLGRLMARFERERAQEPRPARRPPMAWPVAAAALLVVAGAAVALGAVVLGAVALGAVALRAIVSGGTGDAGLSAPHADASDALARVDEPARRDASPAALPPPIAWDLGHAPGPDDPDVRRALEGGPATLAAQQTLRDLVLVAPASGSRETDALLRALARHGGPANRETLLRAAAMPDRGPHAVAALALLRPPASVAALASVHERAAEIAGGRLSGVAAIAFGDPLHLAALVAGESARVRGEAVAALEVVPGAEATETLLRIALLGDREALRVVTSQADDGRAREVRRALSARLADPALLGAERSAELASAIALAGEVGARECIASLAAVLAGPLRRDVLEALARIGSAEAVRAILQDAASRRSLREGAAEALARLEAPGGRALAHEIAASASAEIREAGLALLVRGSGPGVEAALEALRADRRDGLAAALALSLKRGAPVSESLADLLRRGDSGTRRALASLASLGASPSDLAMLPMRIASTRRDRSHRTGTPPL